MGDPPEMISRREAALETSGNESDPRHHHPGAWQREMRQGSPLRLRLSDYLYMNIVIDVRRAR